jgi:predicted PurR-regulated permease PerM
MRLPKKGRTHRFAPISERLSMTENNEANKSKQIESYIGWAVLVIILIGAFFVLQPFLSAAVLAGVLTFSLWPATRRLTRWLRGRRTLAALIMTLTVAMLLVAPFVILGVNLAHDVKVLTSAAIKWSTTGPHPAPAWLEKIPAVGKQVKQYWSDISNEAAKFTRKLSVAAAEESPAEPTQIAPAAPVPVGESKIMETLGAVISHARMLLLNAMIMTGYGILQIVLSLLLMFFFLCDAALGDRFTSAVLRIAGNRGNRLLKVAGDTVRSVIYGIIGTAIVQGVTAGIGFAIAGVPGPVFLGLITFFLSPVPVGPPLVWIPASIWLFINGWTGWGIFMVIWGFGVSSIDNVVKPWLISQGSRMPFLLIFIGVIGGALAFGFIGIFLGPSLLAVTYCLVDEWLTKKM